MKISYNWLRQYIQTDLSPHEIEEILVSIGLEVEAVDEYESIKGGLKNYFVGHVTQCGKHPNADKLSVTKVDVGTGQLLDIVCGAPNVAAGQKVIVAVQGAVVYTKDGSFEIKKTKLRGEVSEGMICAEDEIGTGESHDGILILPENTRIGMPAADYFKIESDYVFEIGITPNRIDAASHYGVARDLAAYLSLHKPTTLLKPSVETFKTENKELNISVTIENKEACKRYCGVTIKGITVKESPEWLKNRLKTIGLRSINNVVDITNFVLHEIGQPLHAFDAAMIKGNKVIVRTLNEGTKFTTLDEAERKLSAQDLMICNEEEGMCIAGIFGGLHSGVTETTKDVFLESAYFNPVWVRKSARRHGLNTDSSFRFERGVDPNNTLFALKRAALLIKELAGGTISSDVVDVYPEAIKDFEVTVSYTNMNRLIGKEIDKTTVKKILAALEIKITKEDHDSLVLMVPPYRVDVQHEADIVEEILRIYGYNNIEISENVNSVISYAPKPDTEKIRNLISDYLSSNGFNEIMNNSLTKADYYNSSENTKDKIVNILNPLSIDLNCMRQSLLFGGLESIAYNINRKNADLKFYEFGNCYFLKNPEKQGFERYNETYNMSVFITGQKEESNWLIQEKPSTFYYLKTYVHNILKRLGIDTSELKVLENTNEYLNEGLRYEFKKQCLVEYGTIDKKYLKLFDIKAEVYYANFNWDNIISLLSNHKVSFVELPKFPTVERDLSMILDETVTFSQIKEMAEKVESKFLKNISLFDVYKGDKIEKGKKSYAVRFILLDEQKTLVDAEIDKIMGRIQQSIEKGVGAKIRSSN